MKQKLDGTDITILKKLQENSSLSNKEISDVVNKSEATITNRIKWLKQNNYILKTVAVLNPKLLGNSVTGFMNFKLHDISEATITNFQYELSLIEGTCECHKTDGKFDVLLKVITKDLESFAQIQRKIAGLNYIDVGTCFCSVYTIVPDNGFDFHLAD